MGKKFKIVFIASIVLNISFVIGFIWARNYIRTKNFELAAITAEAEGNFARRVLSELESEDPNRLEALKTQLRRDIEQTEDVADIWRNAAQK